MGEEQISSVQMNAAALGSVALVTDHADANGLVAAVTGDFIRNEEAHRVLSILHVARREPRCVWTVDLSLIKMSRRVLPLTTL